MSSGGSIQKIPFWNTAHSELPARQHGQSYSAYAKIRRPVADPALDKHILGEIVQKNQRPARKCELVEWVRGAYGRAEIYRTDCFWAQGYQELR